jgi:hypothetical protein
MLRLTSSERLRPRFLQQVISSGVALTVLGAWSDSEATKLSICHMQSSYLRSMDGTLGHEQFQSLILRASTEQGGEAIELLDVSSIYIITT